MTRQLKQRLLIYGSGVFIYICAVAATIQYTLSDWVKFILFLTAYLVIGFDAFRQLADNLMKKEIFSEYLLIILATVGAFGVQRYTEGVLVMLLFELGMMFEAVSTDNAKRSIERMIDIRPEYATRKVRGKETRVEPSELKLRHIIIVKPGERIPVDAVVTAGTSTVDTKALTGEYMPQTVEPGDEIYGGCINLSGVIEARVSRIYQNSTVSKVMEMVEEAQNNKAESETFVTKFSRVYTPVMIVCALFIMIYPSLTFSYGNWDTWIYRGLIFLVVACPCGLVLSIPLAFLAGIASAARQGIVVKGGNYLEFLAKADTFIFDKTGTLTEGVFNVKEIKAEGMTEEELLEMAAHVESYSNHPIAQSLLAAYDGRLDKSRVRRVKEAPGFGISATYDGKRVHIGNYRMLEKQNIERSRIKRPGTVIYLVADKKYAGYIVIADSVKEDAGPLMQYLKEKCRAVLVMLTGDNEASGMEVAEALDMDYAYTDLMPEDKLEQIEDFLGLQDKMEKLVCVGDGINDAPILARADVGIAMGALGSAAAIEAADVVLMEDELIRIKDAIRISKETLRVVSQNIAFSVGVKVVILLLAAVGYFGMWEAILAELGVMFAAILNAVWVVRYTV